MSSRAVREGFKQVKPILSTSREEARSRVLNLYKAWFRQIPYVVKEYDIPVTEKMCWKILREEFDKNRNVTDIRTIDLLVIKGQMDLVETVEVWKQKGHIMKYFDQRKQQKSTDFLTKFYDGQN